MVQEPWTAEDGGDGMEEPRHDRGPFRERRDAGGEGNQEMTNAMA